MLTAATGMLIATGCTPPAHVPTRQWYGAAVISPHTLASMTLGASQGPYTVKCSGTADDLTVDVSAPDGWTGVFKSDTHSWTLRKVVDGESLRITGQPNGVSYLKYNDFTVDSEAFATTPQSWKLAEDTMSVNMYIDCHPPMDSSHTLPPNTSGSTPIPSTRTSAVPGKGNPGGS